MTTAAKILVVEDDRVVARDIQQQLIRIGHSVIGVTARGEEALPLTLAASPDLVLMDIRLEGALDGVEAAQQIRDRCQVPVIFLTAYTDEETVRRASLTEPYGYLLKPFEDSQLRTAIEMALYKHSAERKLRDSERRYVATLSSIGDAVIATDRQARVNFMNPVAESLTGWSQSQAIGRPLSEVFRTVNEETHQAVEDPSARVLRLGTLVGFAQHTLLLARDGREVPIDDCGSPIIDDQGDIVGTVTTFRDLSKQRQDERELRLLLDVIPQFIGVLGPDGTVLRVNRSWVEYLGFNPEGLISSEARYEKTQHPEDVNTLWGAVQDSLKCGSPLEVETRTRRHDGQYRWFLLRYQPLRDQGGQVVRWYVTATDIEDRKQTEARIRNENVALRGQVDEGLMFEEIVGGSRALRLVLADVSKVAPTDSTVLIRGETGTGKELIARAIHKRSQRASRVFVSLNCAVIPPSLIASELFGHEKGAFTGALQRRLGRFELAEGGTLFLDEVGELPAETQMALLRVLQEREFERVGGGKPIHVDVRVIAATNRDLEEAIRAGTFRSDLYYRLNVFPVELPSLRQRREDIPLLVRYFVDRYARKAGKRIGKVSQQSLDLLQSYPWPGNIRELQNVVERSIITCETDTLSVDERWLLTPARTIQPDQRLTEELSDREKTMIEEALNETKGLVSGRSGAAAKLGIPSSTLESKIKALGIDKHRFKNVY